MNQYDPTFDLKINVGSVTYISWSSDFVLHLEEYLVYFGIMGQFDPKFDLYFID